MHSHQRGPNAQGIWEQVAYRDAEQPLRSWVQVVKAARWGDPTAVKRVLNNADILRDGRAVFDRSGNRYRLVAWISYHYGIVYIRFVGSHAE